jgi:hypothetical protein
MTAVAPGPGEVLLDEVLMTQVLLAGHRLGRGELAPAAAPENACPTCRCSAFIVRGDRATCPICDREATIQQEDIGVTLRFDRAANDDHRLTPERLRHHMVDWVMATGPRFMAHRGEIKARQKPYRSMDIEWLSPGSPGDP